MDSTVVVCVEWDKYENKKLAFNSMYLSFFLPFLLPVAAKKDFLNRAKMKHRIRIVLYLNITGQCGDGGNVDGIAPHAIRSRALNLNGDNSKDYFV